MSEVSFATPALHFRSDHAMAVVHSVDDTGLADRLVKARPSTAAFKLGIAFKQSIAAGGAIIGPGLVKFLVLTGPGSFRAFLACNGKHFRREDLFPFFLR